MYVMSSVNIPETAGCNLLFHGCSAHQLDPTVALDANAACGHCAQ